MSCGNAAMPSAIASARSTCVPGGTISVTRPMRSASSTSTMRPLRTRSSARPQPTIAAVSGWAVAGGLELALWCDLRVASESATFGCAERRWGVPLIDGGTQRLPRIVGQGRAMDLILTGRIIDAGEALSWGLITECVPAREPLSRALEIAEGLAQFPQDTMLADRAAALASFGHPLEAGLAIEAAAGLPTLQTALAGAKRFAGGEGRGGAGSGV